MKIKSELKELIKDPKIIKEINKGNFKMDIILKYCPNKNYLKINKYF